MPLFTPVRAAVFALAVLGSLTISAAPADPPANTKDPEGSAAIVRPTYRIGAGDVLQIIVWKEPDASVAAAAVRSDGKVSVPLLKDVQAQGLTTSELERQLNEGFADLIPGADVTVILRESRSKKVYLIGAVKREGPLVLLTPMTALEAIVEAGGFTDFAKVKEIYVLREENGKRVRLPFDYQGVIKGGRPEKDIELKPGDYIYVPK